MSVKITPATPAPSYPADALRVASEHSRDYYFPLGLSGVDMAAFCSSTLRASVAGMTVRVAFERVDGSTDTIEGVLGVSRKTSKRNGTVYIESPTRIRTLFDTTEHVFPARILGGEFIL